MVQNTTKLIKLTSLGYLVVKGPIFGCLNSTFLRIFKCFDGGHWSLEVWSQLTCQSLCLKMAAKRKQVNCRSHSWSWIIWMFSKVGAKLKCGTTKFYVINLSINGLIALLGSFFLKSIFHLNFDLLKILFNFRLSRFSLTLRLSIFSLTLGSLLRYLCSWFV